METDIAAMKNLLDYHAKLVEAHERRKEKQRKYIKERYANDHAFREKMKKIGNDKYAAKKTATA